MSWQRFTHWRARSVYIVFAALLGACNQQDNASRAPTIVDKPAAARLGFVVQETAVPIVAFRFADGEGKPLGLEDFRGKVLLVNVWATWCAPCREEMPTLDRLQAKLGGGEFEVLALSIDRGGVGVVKDFFRDIKLKHLRIYIDQSGQAMFALNVLGIPTTLLVDRDGRELGRLTGMKQWDDPAMVQLLQDVVAKTRT